MVCRSNAPKDSQCSAHSSPGVQALVLPPMSRQMNMTEEQARETWSKLEAAIAKIHEQNASTLSFEELYRYAYNMVLHRHGQMLYSGMEESLRQHLKNVIQGLDSRHDMAFVRQVLDKWKAYHKSTQLIRDILMVRTCVPRAASYSVEQPGHIRVLFARHLWRDDSAHGQSVQYMDRTFVKNYKRVPAYQRGMEIWTEEVIQPALGSQLLDLFLGEVAAERSGDTIDRAVLHSFTSMMTELGKHVYVNELEKPFLAQSKVYFECAPAAGGGMHDSTPERALPISYPLARV